MPDFSAGHPFLLWLEAEITLEGGRTVRVVSDGSWRWNDGPLVFSHVHGGEDWDARRLPAGWAEVGFDDRAWQPVTEVPAPPRRSRTSRGRLWSRLTFHVRTSRGCRQRHVYLGLPAELFGTAALLGRGDGRADHPLAPQRGPRTDGRPTFRHTGRTRRRSGSTTPSAATRPRRTRRGSATSVPSTSAFGRGPGGSAESAGPAGDQFARAGARARGCAEVGAFVCNDALQNAAHRLVDWSLRSNLSYVVTDCPHREKLGWQEQVWHMARATSYRFDTHDLLLKTARDLRDAQLPDGHIPTNCPRTSWGSARTSRSTRRRSGGSRASWCRGISTSGTATSTRYGRASTACVVMSITSRRRRATAVSRARSATGTTGATPTSAARPGGRLPR